MTGAIFVDTNLLVYARDTSEGAKQRMAASWLEALWRDQSGRTSMQVLNEYYITVTRKLKPGLAADDAWDDVQSLLAWQPQTTDAALLAAAREVERRYRLGWWDALVVAAAQMQQCGILLTEDLQDGMSFGVVTVRNPFKMKVAEAAATYQPSTTMSVRHPRRGRPSRVART